MRGGALKIDFEKFTDQVNQMFSYFLRYALAKLLMSNGTKNVFFFLQKILTETECMKYDAERAI